MNEILLAQSMDEEQPLAPTLSQVWALYLIQNGETLMPVLSDAIYNQTPGNHDLLHIIIDDWNGLEHKNRHDKGFARIFFTNLYNAFVMAGVDSPESPTSREIINDKRLLLDKGLKVFIAAKDRFHLGS